MTAGWGCALPRSLHRLDALNHVLQQRIGDELVVHRLHRVLEGFLLDRDDLPAAGLDHPPPLRPAPPPPLPHAPPPPLPPPAHHLLPARPHRAPDPPRHH